MRKVERWAWGSRVGAIGTIGAIVLAGCGGSAGSDLLAPGADASVGNGGGVDASAPRVDAGSDAGSVAPPSADAATQPPPGVTIATSSDVRIIVEPSDSGSALVSAIQGATKSVHMTMYLLTSSAVTNALLAQHASGRDVKVVLDQNFPQGQSNANQTAFDKLKAAGVPVVWAPPAFTYTHEKCVVLDGVEAWVMTMNATQTSPTDNREYLAVDRDAADVAAAEAVFAGDFANQALPVPPSNLLIAPNFAEERLVALVTSAKKTIDVEAEELSDPPIVAALAAAADHGLAVRAVVPAASALTGDATSLGSHGAKIVTLAKPYVHAKAIVVDGVVSYVGSMNFTAGSLLHNREVGLIFAKPSEVAKVATTIDGDFKAGKAL